MSSSKDRTDIAALHGLPSVSEGNNSTWKKEPTIIAIPGSAPMKRPSGYTNPFSSISGGYANVGDVKRSGGMGKPEGSTRPRKMDAMRPRYTEGTGYKPVSNRAKASTLVPTVQGDRSREAKRPRLSGGTSNQHTIDLTGDDLDSRTLLNAAAGPSRRPQLVSKRHRGLNLARDGPYTQRLDQTMNLDEGILDDPIEQFSPSPEAKEGGRIASTSRPKTHQPSGHVQRTIHFFEGKADPLSEPSLKPKPLLPRPKQDLKNHAKPQDPTAAHFAASATHPGSKETKHSGKKRKRNPEEPFMLPLRRCIVKQAAEANIRDASWVTFENNSLKVINGERKVVLDLDIRAYDHRLLTQCAKEVQETAFLWLSELKNGDQSRPDEVALLLHCEHDSWDLETYKELKLWCRPHSEPPFSTTQDLWTIIEEEVQEFRRERENNGGLRRTPPQKPEDQSTETKPAAGKGIDKAPAVARPTATPIAIPRRDSQRPLLGNVYPCKEKHSQGPAQASTSRAVPNTATSPSISKTELVAPLRRSGRQTTATAPRNPADDEVILVFPPDAPGKVTITNADVGRLKPGEFLNDTLIEFGLKLWLKELEEKFPELAKQVHVFSSFFYKKLNKKNHEEGFKSVRKWTSKFDLFDKKYIIVPINENMHWYLAVIYEPEHILRPPPPKPTSPLPPKESEEAVAGDQSVIIASVSKSGSETAPSASTSDGEGEEPSVHEIEVMNVDSPKSPATQTPSEGRPPSPMQLSPEVPVFSSARKAKSAEGSTATSSTAGDEADVLNLVEPDEMVMDNDDDGPISAIPPETFYGSTSTRSGKQYEKPQKNQTRARKSEPKAKETYQPDHTYVLTMDSLGSKHAYAAKQLSRYLVAEAKDKKGVESTATIQMKSVNVPTQPNFCDCGLYLLHLAETFISDAQNLIRKDFETTPRTTNSERQDLWRDFKVPMMRERLLSRIEGLSREWKKAQPQKSSSKDQEDTTSKARDEGSDSDADIIEIGPVTKAKKTPNKQAAARLR